MSDFNLEELFKPRAPSFEDLPDGPIFEAQFASHCDNCDGKIHEGDRARYDGSIVVHAECPKPRVACEVCWLVHGTHQEECDG